MKVYLVGGAVRDKLLGLPIKERDWVVVGMTPEQMIALGYKPVGRDFPVFLHPETNEEYALARTERKSGKGYQGFTFNTSVAVTLEQDLIRRDMTINAIAETLDGKLIDPYGGLQDLKARKLRHVSAAFVEDPVRVLRLARFVAKFEQFHFTVATETMALLKHMVENGEVAHLVAERVWQELFKALQEAHPSQFFHVLRACGADKVVFPEIDKLFELTDPAIQGNNVNYGLCAMQSLDAAATLTPSPKIRFAALLHYVDKVATESCLSFTSQCDSQKYQSSIEIFCERLRVPKDYKLLAILVSKYHGQCHTILQANSTEIVNFLEALDAYRRELRFFEFVIACEADAKATINIENKDYFQGEFLIKAYQASKTISAQPFLVMGIKGLALAEAIHQARIKAVDLWRANASG